MASNKFCAFCNEEVDADIGGELLVGREISVHQYCLVSHRLQGFAHSR